MSDTRSTTYCSPDELAALAEEVRTDTHREIASEIGVSRPVVTQSLNSRPKKYIKVLCQILHLYGVDVEEQPCYRVER